MVGVTFQPIGKRVTVPPGTQLIDAARQAGIELASVCGGEGSCGRCRVRLVSGLLSDPTHDETFILSKRELAQGHRLACCSVVHSDAVVYVPKHSLITESRLQIEGNLDEIDSDPLIHWETVRPPPPSLQDPRSDFDRLVGGLPIEGSFADYDVLKTLSPLARAHDWHLSVYRRGSEIIGVGPDGSPPLGFAVDLGTTKVAAYLLDLESGQELASAGALNPQISYGEDIISRLNYARRHEQNPRSLAQLVTGTLNELLGDLLQQAGQSAYQVADCCIVGNSAMVHLLLQLPTDQLATVPYVAATSAAMDIKARRLGLETAPGAYIHFLPGIGGFVGPDHVAMVLASRMDGADRVTIGIDIGTNTEVALVKPDEGYLAVTSCASGPAFEGAHVSDGMRAASGAIEAVRLLDTGVQVKTIGNSAPIGLCGSGIVGGLAAMRRRGLIDKRGRFQQSNRRLRQGANGLELLLVPKNESGSGRDLVINQQDVNEIQLAKGAIRAGLEALLQASKTEIGDVREVIIAGAFGSFLDIESALEIGLFPFFPKAVYRQVGNAAAVGAKWALISRSARERAKRIASQANYIELTTYPQFRRHFALGMLFPDDEQLRKLPQMSHG